MRKLIAQLPDDRDLAGKIRLEDGRGRVLAGPFEVCGRSDGATAELNGNPTRDPLLPYGNFPLGRYRIRGVVATGRAAGLPAERFGPHGVLVLEPAGGAAAMADANGRFRLLIQGGTLGPGRRLRPTTGSLRLANGDLRRLLSALGSRGQVECYCESLTGAEPGRRVAVGLPCRDEDPPRAFASIRLRGRLPGRSIGGGLRRGFATLDFGFSNGGGGGSGGGGGDAYSGGSGDTGGSWDVPASTPTAASQAVHGRLDDAVPAGAAAITAGVVSGWIGSQLAKGGQPLTGDQQSKLEAGVKLATLSLFDGTGQQFIDYLNKAYPPPFPIPPIGQHPAPPKQVSAKVDYRATTEIKAFVPGMKVGGSVSYDVSLNHFASQFDSWSKALSPFSFSKVSSGPDEGTIGGKVITQNFEGTASVTLGAPSGKLGAVHKVSIGVKYKLGGP